MNPSLNPSFSLAAQLAACPSEIRVPYFSWDPETPISLTVIEEHI